VKIFNTSGNYIGLQAASGSWTSFNLQAPPTKGNNGDVLTSDGAGGTAFTTPSAGGVVQDVTAGNSNISIGGSAAHPTVSLALGQDISLTGTAALSGYAVTGQTGVYAGNPIQQGQMALSDGSINWNYIKTPTGMSSDANFYLPATSAAIGSSYDQLLVYKPGGTIRSIWDTGARLSYLELGTTSGATPGSVTWWGPSGTGWSQSTTVKPSAAPTGNAAWTWLLPGTLSAGMPGRQLTIANYNNNPAAPVLTLEWGNAPGKMAGVPFEVVAGDAAKKSDETFLRQYGDTLAGTSDVYTAVDTSQIVTETEPSPVILNKTLVVDGDATLNSALSVGGNLTASGRAYLGDAIADTVTVVGSIASSRDGTVGLRFTRLGHPGEPGAIITGPGATCAVDRPFPLPGNAPTTGAQIQWTSGGYTQWTNDMDARVLTVSATATLGDARADTISMAGTIGAADAKRMILKNRGGTGTTELSAPGVTGNQDLWLPVGGQGAAAITTNRKAIYIPGLSTAARCVATYDPGAITGAFTAVSVGCSCKGDTLLLYKASAAAINVNYMWWGY
jgi:hypothetical protein